MTEVERRIVAYPVLEGKDHTDIRSNKKVERCWTCGMSSEELGYIIQPTGDGGYVTEADLIKTRLVPRTYKGAKVKFCPAHQDIPDIALSNTVLQRRPDGGHNVVNYNDDHQQGLVVKQMERGMNASEFAEFREEEDEKKEAAPEADTDESGESEDEKKQDAAEEAKEDAEDKADEATEASDEVNDNDEGGDDGEDETEEE